MINDFDFDEILKHHPRYLHSKGVVETALELNSYYLLNEDHERIKISGMLHDITKNYSNDEQLEILKKMYDVIPLDLLKAPSIFHAFTGSYIARTKYNILDEDILNAIFYHTTGRPKMTNLEKLIFLSDFIEPSRIGECFDEVRKLAFVDIDKAITKMYEEEFKFINKNGGFIYALSLNAYNYYKEKTMIEDLIKILDKAVVSDISVYDTTNFTPYFDYVIICSVKSNRQGAAACNYLKKEAHTLNLEVRSAQSSSETTWFLVDLNSVVVHIFVGDERKRYNLDGIYAHLK